eukprot:Opistho-2@68217
MCLLNGCGAAPTALRLQERASAHQPAYLTSAEMGTVLSTGPGVWELRANGMRRPREARTKSSLNAIPTPTHMALVEMRRRGTLKYLVTQNTDGLHRRSGFPANRLSELHGNSNLEICERCGSEFLRDFHTRTANEVHAHYTGRHCADSACNGRLKDSIINFGESLPERALNRAFSHGRRADVCICLGSSLRVTPAAHVPVETARNGGKLVIVNLQQTPLDARADLVIHAFTDTVMQMLMVRLGQAIPPFVLERRCRVGFAMHPNNVDGEHMNGASRKSSEFIAWSVAVTGLEESGVPYSLFKRVEVEPRGSGGASIGTGVVTLPVEPFRLRMSTRRAPSSFVVRTHFHGHYGEPSLAIEHCVPGGLVDDGGEQSTEYVLKYDPATGSWSVSTVGVE